MAGLNYTRMLRELLRGGVTPKFARRAISEIHSHCDDIQQQALAEGCSMDEAASRAEEAIGAETMLVAEILSKPELKSLFWRHPKTLFAFGPMVSVLLVFIGLFLVFIPIYALVPQLGNAEPGVLIPFWTKILLEALFFFSSYLATPLIAILAVVKAKQHEVKWAWPLIGLSLLAFVGSGTNYSLLWPTFDNGGRYNFDWGYTFIFEYRNGGHDLKNYLQLGFTLALSTATWFLYKPSEKLETTKT